MTADSPSPADDHDPGDGARTAFARDLGRIVFPDLPEERRDLYLRIAATYDWTFGLHGRSARAVLWHNRRGQALRFRQLVTLFGPEVKRGGLFRRAQAPVALADLGCGYGALFDWLKRRRWLGPDTRYVGYDLSERMVEAARRGLRDPRARVYLSGELTEDCDYAFASGTFGMKLDMTEEAWTAHCRDLLRHTWSRTRRGLGFNMLNRKGQPDRHDDGSLFYTDPEAWAAFCEDDLGARVRLLTRYTKHDFTVLAWRHD